MVKGKSTEQILFGFLARIFQNGPSNQGVQLTPLARPLGWARSTRQSATACWQHDIPQPSAASGSLTRLMLQGSAARALPGSCLVRRSSTLHTPASGAADARR